MPSKQPWERYDGESAQYFAMFNIWKGLPPLERTLEAVRKNFKNAAGNCHYKSTRQIYDIQHKFEWHERAGEWDNFQAQTLARAELDQRIQARKDMDKRHTSIAKILQDRGLKKFARNIQDRDTWLDMDGVGVNDSLKMLEAGIRYERLINDLPTENVAATITAGKDELTRTLSNADFIAAYTKQLVEMGKLPDPRTKDDTGDAGDTEDDEIHPDSADP